MKKEVKPVKKLVKPTKTTKKRSDIKEKDKKAVRTLLDKAIESENRIVIISDGEDLVTHARGESKIINPFIAMIFKRLLKI